MSAAKEKSAMAACEEEQNKEEPKRDEGIIQESGRNDGGKESGEEEGKINVNMVAVTRSHERKLCCGHRRTTEAMAALKEKLARSENEESSTTQSGIWNGQQQKRAMQLADEETVRESGENDGQRESGAEEGVREMNKAEEVRNRKTKSVQQQDDHGVNDQSDGGEGSKEGRAATVTEVQSQATRHPERRDKGKGPDRPEGGNIYISNLTRDKMREARKEAQWVAERMKRGARYQRNYSKNATVILELNDDSKVTAMNVIKTVETELGKGKLIGVRTCSNSEMELTFEKEEYCKELNDGLQIGDNVYNIRSLCSSEIMVSFLNLPTYIEDNEIVTKLVGWGVTPIFPIRRRFYPGTDIVDGTRFLKVRFPKGITSLPYSARFITETGPQYFRVIHNRQVKTCRLCMNPEHVMKDCELFVCRECLEQGHYARNCTAERCPDCKKVFMRCVCEKDNEERNGSAEEVVFLSEERSESECEAEGEKNNNNEIKVNDRKECNIEETIIEENEGGVEIEEEGRKEEEKLVENDNMTEQINEVEDIGIYKNVMKERDETEQKSDETTSADESERMEMEEVGKMNKASNIVIKRKILEQKESEDFDFDPVAFQNVWQRRKSKTRVNLTKALKSQQEKRNLRSSKNMIGTKNKYEALTEKTE